MGKITKIQGTRTKMLLMTEIKTVRGFKKGTLNLFGFCILVIDYSFLIPACPVRQ
jgi:hypothetical protein